MKMTKREFLSLSMMGAVAGGSQLVATASNTGGAQLAAPATPAARPLKVCVFADIHYHPGGWTNDTPEFLEKIMARAESAGCDMMIHLGDFVHNVNTPLTKDYIRRYNEFRVPGYHILGNHDQDGTPWKQTTDAYRMPDGHYSFDKGGFRFVVADPNYFSETPGSAAGRGRRSTGSRPSSSSGCATRSSTRRIRAWSSRTRASSVRRTARA